MHSKCTVITCIKTPEPPKHLHPRRVPATVVPDPNHRFLCAEHAGKNTFGAGLVGFGTPSIRISDENSDTSASANAPSSHSQILEHQRSRSLADLKSQYPLIFRALDGQQPAGSSVADIYSKYPNLAGISAIKTGRQDELDAPRNPELLQNRSRSKSNGQHRSCSVPKNQPKYLDPGSSSRPFGVNVYAHRPGWCSASGCYLPALPNNRSCYKHQGVTGSPSQGSLTSRSPIENRSMLQNSVPTTSKESRITVVETPKLPKSVPVRPQNSPSSQRHSTDGTHKERAISTTQETVENQTGRISEEAWSATLANFMASLTPPSSSEPQAGSPRTQPLCEPQFLSGPVSNSRDWMYRVDRVNEAIGRCHGKKPKSRRPRIAVLDTGYDPDSECIMTLPNGEGRLNKRWKDWVDASPGPIDEDDGRHGTALAALTLRVAAHADIYIGRIARNNAELNGSVANIVKAIFHAAHQWQVDIISMSFGFPGSVSEIHEALSDVSTTRRREGRPIVFFGAANNDGLNAGEAYPASDDNVISVRGTNHHGAFEQAYNPEHWAGYSGGPRLGTLATDVPYDVGSPTSCKSGCSMATPILAGIASTIIYDVDRMTADDEDGLSIRSRLRTRKGMLHVLSRIASSSADQPLQRYVAPWRFFDSKDQDRLALVRSVLAELQPQHPPSQAGA